MLLVSVGSSLVTGALSSYFTFQLQFVRHQAMDKQREKDWTAWRLGIEARVTDLEKTLVTRDDFATMIKDNKEQLQRIESLIQANALESKVDRKLITQSLAELVTRITVEEHRSK